MRPKMRREPQNNDSSASKLARLERHASVHKNLVYATVAQVVVLASSLVMNFAVTKVLSVEEYGYWQLFSLYSSYVGLTAFGINDGLVLRLSGSRVRDIDFGAVKGELISYILLQAIIFAGLLTILLLGGLLQGERLFVALAVLVFGLLCNAFSFCAYLFQAVNLAGVQSVATIISRGLFCAALIGVVLDSGASYRVLVAVYILAQAASFAFCLRDMHEVLLVKAVKLSRALRILVEDARAGIKVSIAYFADQLVVGSVRFFIDAQWGISAFGILSFAFSIIAFFLNFIMQLSVVLLPALKRADPGSSNALFYRARLALMLILPLTYLVYFPASYALRLWVPQYAQSMNYLVVLLPICVFDCKMSLLCGTYLKARRKEGLLLTISLATMAASVILSLICIFLLDNVFAALVCIDCCIAARSAVAEFAVVGVGRKSVIPLALEILLAAAFVLFIYVVSDPAAFLYALAVYYLALLLASWAQRPQVRGHTVGIGR